MAYIGTAVKRLLPLVAAAAVLVAGGGAFLAVRAPSAEQVVTRLLHARYVNDARAVYALAAAVDRRARTLEEHLASHPSFPDDFQELIGELARFIEVRSADRDLQAQSGVVTVRGSVPNANHPETYRLLHGEGDAAALSLRARRAELRRRGRAGTLPVIEFTEQVELVREEERWTVFLDWAVGYTIHFRAEVREQLPFEFSVEPASITLKPGETGSATFHGHVPRAQRLRGHPHCQGGPPVRAAGGVPAHRAGAVLLLLRGHFRARGGAADAGGVAPRLGHSDRPRRDYHALRVLPFGAVPGPAAGRGPWPVAPGTSEGSGDEGRVAKPPTRAGVRLSDRCATAARRRQRAAGRGQARWVR